MIGIRSEVGKVMGSPDSSSGGGGPGAKADAVLVSTPVDAMLSTHQRNHAGPVLPPPSREGGARPDAALQEIATLQVGAGCFEAV